MSRPSAWLATVITLGSRPDRRASFEKWATAGDGRLPFDLRVLRAERSPHGGKRGCADSHARAIRYAHSISPDAPSAHFEDDAIPTAAWADARVRAAVLREVFAVMHFDPHWRVIGLGGCPLTYATGRRAMPAGFAHIWRVPFVEAHAYVVSPAFRRHLLSVSYEGHFDYVMARESGAHAYLVRPELFEQDPSLGSDNASVLKLFIHARRPFKSLHVALTNASGRLPWRLFETGALVGLAFALGAVRSRRARLVCLAAFLALAALHIANIHAVDPYVHYTEPKFLRKGGALSLRADEPPALLDVSAASDVISTVSDATPITDAVAVAE